MNGQDLVRPSGREVRLLVLVIAVSVIVLIVLIGYGLVGFINDYRKVALKNPKGLAGRYKLLGQFVFGVVALLFLFYATPYDTTL